MTLSEGQKLADEYGFTELMEFAQKYFLVYQNDGITKGITFVFHPDGTCGVVAIRNRDGVEVKEELTRFANSAEFALAIKNQKD